MYAPMTCLPRFPPRTRRLTWRLFRFVYQALFPPSGGQFWLRPTHIRGDPIVIGGGDRQYLAGHRLVIVSGISHVALYLECGRLTSIVNAGVCLVNECIQNRNQT